MTETYYVYVLASRSRVLYVGMTRSLTRRLEQHRDHDGPSFTRRYRAARLVYAERCGTARAAIAREKQIKRWRREKKLALIQSINPEWRDLSDEL